MERAATTASSLEAEHDSGNINRYQSMATLNESFPQGTDLGSGPSPMKWGGQHETKGIDDSREVQITATIDGKAKLVSEASIRRHLRLEGSDGMVKNLDSISKFLMYPRFIQILLNKHKRHLLPYNKTYIDPTLTQKLFSNMRRASKGYTGVDIPLFPTMLVQGPILQGEGSTVPVESYHTHSGAPTTS
ncbi:hypothetical protein Tco_0654883 [Tanacetum coccineum]|uniref:Uncharacterized protein n=1 Tax=Tanacetum coccineum TaxID=301880 RepID=A0ABQ4X4L4_9ASTR